MVDTWQLPAGYQRTHTGHLQFPVVEKCKAQTADECIIECDVVSPIELRFKNRRFSGSAIVLPDESEPLLGAIPLEDMGVLIHPLRQSLSRQNGKLIVNPDHPYFAQIKLK